MAQHYQITLHGTLDESWSEWFDGLTITHDAAGYTHLTGMVRDQTALYGLIDKARDLALTLVAVIQIPPAPHNGLDPPPELASERQE